MVKMTLVAPSIGIDVADGSSVTVDPSILMGIWAVTVPAVAVIHAVRFIGFPGEENVTVAGVVVLVVTFSAEMTPVLVLMVTLMPFNAAFLSLMAITVMVVAVEPSDLTVVEDAFSRMAAAVSSVGGVVFESAPVPHPQRNVRMKAEKMKVKIAWYFRVVLPVFI